MEETTINLYEDQRTLYCCDKGLIGKLTRLGLPVVKNNDYGTWFDMTGVTLSLQVPKIRGTGNKSLIL